MEPSMEWAGNPNIIIAAKAFGLRATVQVVDLQVFASPSITLKPLVPSFPCFAKILVSLMEKVRGNNSEARYGFMILTFKLQ
ncbi:synaptotagmin-1-like [Actinidia eriantha]|uniref:synaptotagmin-1-like n=1 Tax=Actinidia eriantha TaxID=165200 RepID=UPI0025892D74|nr:synaptotagmin-1-like [Actinidia eriantha]